MKKIFAILMMAAALAACMQMEQPATNEEPEAPQEQETIQTYTMTIAASKGTDTKALSLGGEDNKTLNATWATSEHIYVKKGNTWAEGSLQPQEAGETTTLKGELSGVTIGETDELTLQFPRSGEISYSGQKGTLADIAANYDYATATVKVESISPSGNINPVAETTTFNNQQAIIQFTLLNKATSAAISPSALTISDGTNTVSLTDITSATYTANEATNVLYVAFPATGAAKTITMTATVGEDTFTYEKAGVTFTNGQYYAIKVKMSLTKTIAYTGAVQTFTVPATGYYTLECYGAQGGNAVNGAGGLGGWSKLVYPLTQGDVLYIYVGGQGGSIVNGSGESGAAGGWNGGGKGGDGVPWRGNPPESTPYSGGGGGGGATHIANSAVGPITSSTDFTANHDGLLLIAGGGGGGLILGNTSGGNGGGNEGGKGKHNSSEWNIDWNNGTLSCGKNGMKSSNGPGSCEGCGGGGAGYIGGNTWEVSYNANDQGYSGAGGSSWGDITNGKGFLTTSGGATAGGDGKAVITWYGTSYATE